MIDDHREQRIAIHEALRNVFPTQGDLDRALTLRLGEARAHLTTASGLHAQLTELLAWAIRGGRLRALLDAAAAEVPGNPALAALRARYDDTALDAIRLPSVLDAGTAHLPDEPAPSQLLDARHQVVPWHERGREEILAELNTWADGGAPTASLWLLHAEGGVGKTRLAIEWTRRLRARGWDAGFLPRVLRDDWLEPLQHTAPVLVVVEYAESRRDLAYILRSLRMLPQRTRVLLLARNDGDWWATAHDRDRELRAWMDLRPPRVLVRAAASAPERSANFEDALQVFAAVRGMPTSPPRLDLSDLRFDRTLYLHMAALATVERAPFTAASLMDVTLDHEENFWFQRASTEYPTTIRRDREIAVARKIVVAATLRGLDDPEDTITTAARMLERALSEGERDLTELLRRIYQRANTAVTPPVLEPDLLGEAMTVRLARGPGTALERVDDAWIERVLPAEATAPVVENALTVLGRAASETETAGVLRPWIRLSLTTALEARAIPALNAAKHVGQRTAFSILGDVMCEVLRENGTPNIAASLDSAGMPNHMVSLRALAHWTAETLRAAMPSSEEPSKRAERARLLNDEAVRLSDLGRREEAMRFAQEAVGNFRQLAEVDPKSFRSALAASLVNLGIMSRVFGQHSTSLQAASDSVREYRALTELNPNAHLLGLATSLPLLRHVEFGASGACCACGSKL
jgi:hypothetical protein